MITFKQLIEQTLTELSSDTLKSYAAKSKGDNKRKSKTKLALDKIKGNANVPASDVEFNVSVMISHHSNNISDRRATIIANRELGTRGLKLVNVEFDGTGKSIRDGKEDYFFVVTLAVDQKHRQTVLSLVKRGIADIELTKAIKQGDKGTSANAKASKQLSENTDSRLGGHPANYRNPAEGKPKFGKTESPKDLDYYIIANNAKNIIGSLAKKVGDIINVKFDRNSSYKMEVISIDGDKLKVKMVKK